MKPLASPERRRAYGLGLRAETLAALLLRLKLYRIIARRLAEGGGEIDLVAVRGRMLVFVEVKARADFTAAAEAVTPMQRRRIVRGAESFLARRPAYGGYDVRFDVILVAPRRWPRHIANAFDAGA
jgi:putative endonuclease